jgi:hypothetical protein
MLGKHPSTLLLSYTPALHSYLEAQIVKNRYPSTLPQIIGKIYFHVAMEFLVACLTKAHNRGNVFASVSLVPRPPN